MSVLTSRYDFDFGCATDVGELPEVEGCDDFRFAGELRLHVNLLRHCLVLLECFAASKSCCCWYIVDSYMSSDDNVVKN